MRTLTLLILMTIGANSYTQSECLDSTQIASAELDIKHARNDAWMRLSIGLFAHAIGSTAFISGPITDPDVFSQFMMYNTIGIGIDIFAIIQFNRVRKLKKKLKLQI